MSMKTAYLSFTAKGKALADGLATRLGGTSDRCHPPITLDEWTQQHFHTGEALVFVGAVGIAVRAIAPYVKDKTTDPAVVVVDERARFVIPILSGHLGGANELAREISTASGATPVITTATDINGVFAMDEWGRRNGCRVMHKEEIKRVSASLLAGNTIRVCSEYPIEGTLPKGISMVNAAPYDVYIGLHTPTVKEHVLWLVPRIGVLGVGCKKAMPEQMIEASVYQALREWSISELAVSAVATIDIKKDEPGLLSYCERHGFPLMTYSAEELQNAPGHFKASAFVAQVTGVDNVCERSAVLGADNGQLVGWKTAFGGVTAALAVRDFHPKWD